MTQKHDDPTADLLIKEVDEELRQEQLSKLWNKYGNLIIAGAVVLVLAVAGVQAWKSWQAKERQAASARFSAAIAQARQGQADPAAEALAKMADAPEGYQVLAELKRAELRQAAGDNAGAIAIYEQVAGRSGLDDVYRNLARLKAAYLKLDAADPAEVERAMEPLAVESSPWRHSAREILALVATKRGDQAKAADLFRKIADDPAAPQGLRARAAEMLAASGQKSKG